MAPENQTSETKAEVEVKTPPLEMPTYREYRFIAECCITRPVYGYKILGADGCGYGGYKYEVGKTFVHEGSVYARLKGLHYCLNPVDCNVYPDTGFPVYVKPLRYFQVLDLGDERSFSDGTTSLWTIAEKKDYFQHHLRPMPVIATNKLQIVKEFTLEEWNQMTTGSFTCNGTTFHLKNGVPHKIGAPAVQAEKCIYYYEEGKLHRLDGPAIKWISDKCFPEEDDLVDFNFKDGIKLGKSEIYKLKAEIRKLTLQNKALSQEQAAKDSVSRKTIEKLKRSLVVTNLIVGASAAILGAIIAGKFLKRL